MKPINHSLESTLKQSEKRAYQHWYQDGLAEAAVGGYAVLVGLLFFGERWLGGPGISAILLPSIMVGGVLMHRSILRRLKARISYSRTGYVSYQEPSKRLPWLALGLVFALGLLIGVVLVLAELPSPQVDFDYLATWLTLLLGGIFAAPSLYLAYQFDLRRYYILAIVSVLLGIVVYMLRLGYPLAPAAYFTAMGVAVVISGLLTLQRYLRHGQPYQEAT